MRCYATHSTSQHQKKSNKILRTCECACSVAAAVKQCWVAMSNFQTDMIFLCRVNLKNGRLRRLDFGRTHFMLARAATKWASQGKIQQCIHTRDSIEFAHKPVLKLFDMIHRYAAAAAIVYSQRIQWFWPVCSLKRDSYWPNQLTLCIILSLNYAPLWELLAKTIQWCKSGYTPLFQ